MTPARHIDSRVVHDAVYPRAERHVRVEACQIAIGLQKRLLNNIFGFLPSDQTGRVYRQRSLVSLDQHSKGVSVRERLSNQLLVRRLLSARIHARMIHGSSGIRTREIAKGSAPFDTPAPYTIMNKARWASSPVMVVVLNELAGTSWTAGQVAVGGRWHMALDRSMFRMYDIRGEVGLELTTEAARCIGRGYVHFVRQRTGAGNPIVAVGRDVRPSSQDLAAALIDGITSQGGDVVDIGIVPTPTLYYALFSLHVDGGIMITGSHNPPQYNGFKVAIGRETLYGDDIQHLADLAEVYHPIVSQRGSVSHLNLLSTYRDELVAQFGRGPLGASDKPRIKVVVDCANGCAGLVVPSLLKQLRIDAVLMYPEPDGTFPNHHPDPARLDTLAGLREHILAEKADFGIAYDGDVDRIGAMDQKGDVVWGDKLTYIFAADIIAHWKGPDKVKVIGEVKCSKTLFDGVKELGGQAIMSPTGHSLIKKRMREENAQLAGEMSGHMFFADRYYGYDDAIYASLRLMEIVTSRFRADPGFVFSDLLRKLQRTVASPEMRRPCREEEKEHLVTGFVDAFRRKFPKMAHTIEKVVTIDGARVEWADGWGLVRASNTEPLLVLRFEAKTQERVNQLQQAFDETLASLARPGKG
jgi:phosphomannomutase/phosphoglucomutase